MKDGSAHPTNPAITRTGEHGEQWGPIGTSTVTFHPDTPDEQRAAVELERIARRYCDDDRLPDRKSAAAKEILEAAHLLYIELYRDCGTEARRQKLRGAELLRRWIEKQLENVEAITKEDQDRWRAYIVEDLIELGITRKSEGDQPTMFEVAEEIASHHDWRLGAASTFKSAYYKWKKNPDWLTSGTGSFGYRKITQDDINAVMK